MEAIRNGIYLIWCDILKWIGPSKKKYEICKDKCGKIIYGKRRGIGKEVARYGMIFPATVSDKKGYIVKVQMIYVPKASKEDNDITNKMFNNEVSILKKVSNLGKITPKLVDSWKCTDPDGNKFGFILMNDWCYDKEGCGNLHDRIYLLKGKSQEDLLRIFQKLLDKYYVLHSNDIIHYDVRRPNILYQEDERKRGEEEVSIIDFGVSKNVSKWEKEDKINFFILDLIGVVQLFVDYIDGLEMGVPLGQKGTRFIVLKKINNDVVLDKLVEGINKHPGVNVDKEKILELVNERFEANQWVEMPSYAE